MIRQAGGRTQLQGHRLEVVGFVLIKPTNSTSIAWKSYSAISR